MNEGYKPLDEPLCGYRGEKCKGSQVHYTLQGVWCYIAVKKARYTITLQGVWCYIAVKEARYTIHYRESGATSL